MKKLSFKKSNENAYDFSTNTVYFIEKDSYSFWHELAHAFHVSNDEDVDRLHKIYSNTQRLMVFIPLLCLLTFISILFTFEGYVFFSLSVMFIIAFYSTPVLIEELKADTLARYMQKMSPYIQKYIITHSKDIQILPKKTKKYFFYSKW